MKYMMAKVQPEQIKYYGAIYEGSLNFIEATEWIQKSEKVLSRPSNRDY